ncbi:hypothetical protein D3C86_1647790 [compost metagenome]
MALLVGEAVDDDAGRQAEEAVDAAHGGGVALCQVVVDGDDVHALAGKCVQIDGQGGDERLAFAGLHFGDGAFVQDHATDQLDVEGTQAKHAAGRLAGNGKSRHQKVVQCLAVCEFLAEFHRLGGECLIRQSLHIGFKSVDGIHPGLVATHTAIVGGAKQLAG